MSSTRLPSLVPSLARAAVFLLVVLPLVIAANLAVWSAVYEPVEAEPWTGEIVGMSFSPFRLSQDPAQGRYPNLVEIDSDLKLLSGSVQAIRTYSATDGFERIPRLAKDHGISVAAGAWIGQDTERNSREVATVKEISFHRNVVRVLVGNEALLREEVTVEELIGYIRDVKRKVWKPVSTAETWHTWLDHPELVQEVDFIGVQILPYWEGVPVHEAVDFVFDRLADLERAYPDKPIVVTEVGWPSRGRPIPRIAFEGMTASQADGEAVASLVNQAKFLRAFLNRAHDANLTYYVIEAFDQPWKADAEGLAGSYWGIYDAARAPKFPMQGGVAEQPQWRLWASLAVGLAAIPGVLFVLRRRHVRPLGIVLFVIFTQLAASAAAWVGLSATGIYFTSTTAMIWSALFLAQGLLLIVLMTEAIEFVEVIWTRRGERHFEPLATADGARPGTKVSIHVPIHNEPPEMVRETLAALARLDYDNFEVLVLDNNTADAATWRPVEAACEALGPKFRFFHLEDWPGFKAGALNFGLEQTAPDAEVIAVIDSDYQVDSDWLACLVPYFAKPDVAFVQAPQDYRDGRESLFKDLCNWEYAGFFHIGMVQRNNFNAVIQHGTMTLIRKAALEKVGGWAEWCICEDAELGLKLYREGYDSVYVNHSFGRGITPDTLSGYMGQRLRWAYGAMQIFKRHWRAFLPGAKSGLTAAQRYYFVAGWLPWFADGLALLFTFASIGLSIWALASPHSVGLPVAAFMIPIIGSFGFKFIRSLWLYALRVRCSFLKSLGACVAALALTHTVAKAVLNGLVTSDKPFFRTPKCEDKPALATALTMVREEALMLTLLWALAVSFYLHPQFQDSLSRLWMIVLLVQSLPYAASVVMSLINVAPALRRGGARRALEAPQQIGTVVPLPAPAAQRSVYAATPATGSAGDPSTNPAPEQRPLRSTGSGL